MTTLSEQLLPCPSALTPEERKRVVEVMAKAAYTIWIENNGEGYDESEIPWSDYKCVFLDEAEAVISALESNGFMVGRKYE